MGIRLVSQALSPEWGCLSETARLVLISMCYIALDTASGNQPARRYFAGHEVLILTLTGQDPSDSAWCNSKNHQAAQRRVKRAVRELADAGAIAVLAPANGRRKAIYEILPASRDNSSS